LLGFQSEKKSSSMVGVVTTHPHIQKIAVAHMFSQINVERWVLFLRGCFSLSPTAMELVAEEAYVFIWDGGEGNEPAAARVLSTVISHPIGTNYI
jgi:hypothetical protein